MKAFLRTWRHGIDTVLVYHGSGIAYDQNTQVMCVLKPVLDSGLGELTAVTIVAGDEITVERCSPTEDVDRFVAACSLHHEPEGKELYEKIVLD